MKKLIIIVPVLIVLIAALGWYGYTKRSGTAADIEGRWALSSGDTGCYTTVRFVANPATSGGAVSIEETSGNVVQMSYGNYSTGKNQSLEVQLTNPEAPAFSVEAERKDEVLTLQYDIQGTPSSCTYKVKELTK
ncbi:hypothetical protein MKY96_14520 [Paenibacillus sp. FSL R7-0302]|uniref:hypothetical protein n=1 Tax=Paenibacillus sp. FSL R7-0302 TaxID=2921681 RepID=UPI0030F8D146